MAVKVLLTLECSSGRTLAVSRPVLLLVFTLYVHMCRWIVT